MKESTVNIFGIRHHGPGSARSLVAALDGLVPDCILVEGPPDANQIIKLVADPQMTPPVALLVYCEDSPQTAVYYPFAAFSPEWQAILWAVKRDVTVRFMDLPQSNWLAVDAFRRGRKRRKSPPGTPDAESDSFGDQPSQLSIPLEASGFPTAPSDNKSESEIGSTQRDEIAADEGDDDGSIIDIRDDPLTYLAQAAGYGDGEQWWEHMVELRRDSTNLFAAVTEAMAALRAELPEEEEPSDRVREAQMREIIRSAQKEGFQRIAVVCGAWHAPALQNMPPAKQDAALLKGLKKLKVQCTWIPWTYSRLSFDSGYGAGIHSPGWYHHIWTSPDNVIPTWLTHVARLLRSEDLDASSAHIIDAGRLANTLAALRDRPAPGLSELNESIKTVLCFGSDVPMQLIHDRLIVGEILGSVPENTPGVPLQNDVRKQQKRLRLQPDPTEKLLDLDLRKENDLARSHLLHRLNLLDIDWGIPEDVIGKSGTFHEIWKLRWRPEMSLALIESSVWGKTVSEAASARACDRAEKAADLPALTSLLESVLLSDLPDATQHLMARLGNEAAVASDITHLMASLKPLAQIVRYGDVRRTDVESVRHVIDGLVARICAGLPLSCLSLNTEAAATMFEHLLAVHRSIMLLEEPAYTEEWQEALEKLSDRSGVHGLIGGRACRLLLEMGIIGAEAASKRLSYSLSMAADPTEAAMWAEGFLSGSGLVLLHHEGLWRIIDEWLTGLTDERFQEVVPLLRRTFSTFSSPERRQMGERVANGARGIARAIGSTDSCIDEQRADAVLQLVAQILGIQSFNAVAGSGSMENLDV